MRVLLFGAVLALSLAFGAVAPTVQAQQYGGYPGNPYADQSGNYLTLGNGYGIPYSGNYGGGYSGVAGSYGVASPYAAVCGSLAYLGATQGYAAVAGSPYAFTCSYLGLLGGAAGFGTGYAASGGGIFPGSGASYLGLYDTSSYGSGFAGSWPRW